jgi:hypothetical protein
LNFNLHLQADSSAQRVITQALYLGNPDSFNSTREDCVWKHNNERDICPDPNISVILYTSNGVTKHKNEVSSMSKQHHIIYDNAIRSRYNVASFSLVHIIFYFHWMRIWNKTKLVADNRENIIDL